MQTTPASPSPSTGPQPASPLPVGPQPAGPLPAEFGADPLHARKLRLPRPGAAGRVAARRRPVRSATPAEPSLLAGPGALPDPGTAGPVPLAPAWGWKLSDAGRAVHVTPGVEFQATTTQLCGLFPFVAGSGTPTAGTRSKPT